MDQMSGQERESMNRLPRALAAGLSALAVAVAVGGCNSGGSHGGTGGGAAVAKKDEVTTIPYVTPATETVTDFEEFTGRTEAVKSVEIRARVTGYLDKVMFKDGSDVKEDQVLFEIDPRPYQATYERAQATLDQAEAREKRLEADFGRANALFSRGTLSREEYDKTASDLAESKGAIGIARADRDLAKLNLEWTKVTAPIAGRISRRMVDPGNLVKSDETMLTTIVALDPLYVYFDIDERTVLKIRRMIAEGRMKSRAEAAVPILAALAGEADYPHKGTIDFSENRVDPGTGTLRVRAVIDNPAAGRPNAEGSAPLRSMSPGLFIRVRLPLGDPHPSLVIPEKAIGVDQGIKYVYVVKDGKDKDGKPVQNFVRQTIQVGSMVGDRRVVDSGLKPDDRVIVSGLQRIRPGENRGLKAVPLPEFEAFQRKAREAAPVAAAKTERVAGG